MEFSIATLLANFPDDKLVAPKALEKKLNCEDEESLRKLQIALDALEKIGILVKERGKYRRIFEEDVVEGKLRCSSKGFCFAIQDIEGSEDIYIRESHLSTAWNGDRVLVKVTKEGSRRRSPEGEVRLILERANSSVLARVKQAETSYRAVPLDDRLLFELELQPNGQGLDETLDKLVHVEIVRYPLGQNPPLGRVVQILGSDAQTASDIDIVCCKHDLPRQFSDAVLEAAKALPSKVRKADLKKRLDLRDLPTITIDSPATLASSAIDDAITLEELEDNQWRLGIHVSDVSYYIPHRSPLDLEAQKRGTSIHLGDVVLPILPEPVFRCCALVPEQDRLVISLLIILDETGQVLEFEVQPGVIQVDYQLNYQQAQGILLRNQPEAAAAAAYPLPSAKELDAFSPIFDMVDQLYALSQGIRAHRQNRGAFELNLPERVFPPDETSPELAKFLSTKFDYDDEGALGAMVVSSLLPARSVVTELMLLTNHLIASHLKALQVPAVYRVHRTPDPADVQELLKLVSNMGIDSHLEQEDAVHSRDYQRLTQAFAESKAEKVLTYLLLSTLKPAVYSTTPGTHFGLALEDGYTHFTYPLRRYPDLLVHRVLHAVFEYGRDRRSTRSKDAVDLRSSTCHGQINWGVLPPEIHSELEENLGSIAIHLTEQERLAQEAEADLEGLKKAEFMQQHTGEVFHGLITGVQSYGFFVEIEELLVEGLVHVSSLKDDWYEYRSRQQKLVGRKNRKQYRLGDRVEVQVKSVDYYRQQIDLVAVGGGSEALDEDEVDEAPLPAEAVPLLGHPAHDYDEEPNDGEE
ncbi:VacB/RNase II family 3'-5' exoribonuclease [Oscillatoria sp. FACHB-1407]|uniref:ribonuclease R family protein n=1 Tax=Oscillatoria sp. FACHB-1407 TaxID=2692847 RepID=UPI001686A0D3|nr:ribonuclease R family protein [Oscillatoria sp. FACHB-1407]MBD2463302.1 VacB/RNase II family 3'-5' exoribonuclease [Oscillatoria sp. FACHB-1407]